jgi:Leucine-rich repeat (LRR) protein
MFEGLRRLNYMTLDHNRLTSIEVESFVDLKSLSFLNLADNDLNSIDVGTFAGLQSLQKLWLMRNKLTSIANGTFLKLLALTGELYIYENKDLVHTSDNITVLRSAWGVPSGCEPGICLRYGERCVAQGCPDDGIIG